MPKANPLKNKDYHNVHRILEQKRNTLTYRVARHKLFETLWDKVLASNPIMMQYIGLSRVSHLDPLQRDTITVGWDWFYPHISGEKAYCSEEESFAKKTNVMVFAMIEGDNPGQFRGTVHFDWKSKNTNATIEIPFEERAFAKTDFTMPLIIVDGLKAIVANNLKFMKL